MITATRDRARRRVLRAHAMPWHGEARRQLARARERIASGEHVLIVNALAAAANVVWFVFLGVHGLSLINAAAAGWHTLMLVRAIPGLREEAASARRMWQALNGDRARLIAKSPPRHRAVSTKHPDQSAQAAA